MAGQLSTRFLNENVLFIYVAEWRAAVHVSGLEEFRNLLLARSEGQSSHLKAPHAVLLVDKRFKVDITASAPLVTLSEARCALSTVAGL